MFRDPNETLQSKFGSRVAKGIEIVALIDFKASVSNASGLKDRVKEMKTGFKIHLLLIGILALGIMFAPTVYAGSIAKDSVSVEDAEIVASYYVQYIPTFMDSFAEWKDATVERGITYYDLDGDISAYSFNVLDNGEYAGYIMISATKDNYPVLGFSKGKVPNAVEGVTATLDSMIQTEAKERQLKIKSETPLYLGGTFYYMQYSLADATGNVVEEKIVDMTSPATPLFCNESVIQQIFGDEETLNKQQKIKEKDARAQWVSIESRMNGDSEFNSVSTRGTIGWISGVPNYAWTIGCTPTSAAMVLAYWHNHGYSSLPTGYTLINELASEMGTYNWPVGGTWPWDMDDGIEAVCDNHGYSSISSSNDYTLSWSETKNEINRVRPFVLSMTYGGVGSGHTQAYGMHSVTCMGYSDGTEDYVFLHDTWDNTNEHYLAFGNWVAAMGTWVRP